MDAFPLMRYINGDLDDVGFSSSVGSPFGGVGYLVGSFRGDEMREVPGNLPPGAVHFFLGRFMVYDLSGFDLHVGLRSFRSSCQQLH